MSTPWTYPADDSDLMPCHLCGVKRDADGEICRPYGAGGKPICWDCAYKPENEATTRAGMAAALEASPLRFAIDELKRCHREAGEFPADALQLLVGGAAKQAAMGGSYGLIGVAALTAIHSWLEGSTPDDACSLFDQLLGTAGSKPN